MRECLKRTDVGLPDGARVTATFGVAQFVPEETASELVRCADMVVYRAKRAGRDRAHVAETDEDDSATDGTLGPGAHGERPGVS